MITTYPCETCGSESATSDFCDVCGRPIAGPPTPATAPSAAQASAAEPPVAEPVAVAAEPAPGTAGTCYFCGAPRGPDDDLCEVCGLDFVSGEMPPPAPSDPTPTPPEPMDEVSAPVPMPDVASGTTVMAPSAVPVEPVSVPTAAHTRWIAEVGADRAFFDGNVTAGVVTFPEGVAPAAFLLEGAEFTIGRRSESKGYHPDIDLSSPVDDPAVSRRHAVLRKQPDGSWAVLDVGSTNGTWLNDEQEPLAQGVVRPVDDGDRILLGAFTCITIRAV